MFRRIFCPSWCFFGLVACLVPSQTPDPESDAASISESGPIAANDPDPQTQPGSENQNIEQQPPNELPPVIVVPPPETTPVIVSIAVDAPQLITNAEVTFDASAFDADGDTLSYEWDFGDGLRGYGATTSHRFWGRATPGWNYPVTLTVSDPKGHSVTSSTQVTITTPPHRTVPIAAPYSPPNWTTGHKRVLVMVVRFADQASTSAMTAPVNAYKDQAMDFVNRVSGGALTMEMELSDDLVLAGTAQDYTFNSTGYWDLQRDARIMARAHGWDPDTYDLDVTLFDGALVGQNASSATNQGRGMILNTTSLSTFLHELGHGLGFGHSNAWRGSYGTFGLGQMVNYGCPWDLMGNPDDATDNPGTITSEYSAMLKTEAHWLTGAQVKQLTTSQVFTLNAHDQGSYDPNQAYVGVIDAGRRFWLEHRRSIANPYLQNGLIVMGSPDHDAGSQVIFDTTPLSKDTSFGPLLGAELTDDSALTVGRSVTIGGEYHVTVLSSDSVSHSLQVGVVRELPGANSPPALAIVASDLQPTTADTVTLSATATDAVGDQLVFAWNFDDGTFTTDAAAVQVNKQWSLPGRYVVRAEVSDQRGGVARASLVIHVGLPKIPHVSGHVKSMGLALADAVVRVRSVGGSSFSTLTDSNGFYALSLSPGTYDVSATKLGYGVANGGSITVSAMLMPAVVDMNVTLGNGPAGFSGATSLAATEDEPSEDLSMTWTDTGPGSVSAGLLSFTVTSDNPALIAPEDVWIRKANAGATHKAQVLSLPHAHGVAHLGIIASDGVSSTQQIVTVTVSPVAEAPIARHDEYVMGGATLVIAAPGVLGNDFDPDNEPLTVTLFQQAQHGTVALGPDGSFSYTPTAGFHGRDAFVYRVTDSSTAFAEAAAQLVVP